MNRCELAGLQLAWECGDLPFDPFEPAMPLPLDPSDAPEREAATDITIRAALIPAPLPSPERQGAVAVLYHGTTRCFLAGQSLVLWDGASILQISPDGRSIDARVHVSSLERPFAFSSQTITMTLLLALRFHRLFHLHAAAARLPDSKAWVIAGDSGCGKSTLALALFCAGAQWVSDDVLLLRSSGTGVEAMGWARKVRVSPQTSAAFASLGSFFTACPSEGALRLQLDPRQAFPGRGLRSVGPPLTLILPRIGTRQSSTAVRLNGAEAFGRILHACAWVASEHLPHRQAQLYALKHLVDNARAFDVSVGTRILSEPEAALAEIKELTR